MERASPFYPLLIGYVMSLEQFVGLDSASLTRLNGNLLSIVVVVDVVGAVVAVIVVVGIVIIIVLGWNLNGCSSSSSSSIGCRFIGSASCRLSVQLLLLACQGALLLGLIDGLPLALDNVDFHLDAVQLRGDGL